MKKLIIFADYGLDDAAATATILQRYERFDAIDIVAIGGNVPSDVSLRNCYTLVSYFPEVWGKLTVVDTTEKPQPSEYLAEIHGNDGMGDLFDHSRKTEVKTMTFDAWLSTTDGTEQLLSLGPMTLVKPLMDKHPGYRPVIMGGRVRTAPNYHGYEFNHGLDKAAFADCTKADHAVITLDTVRTEKLDMRLREVTGSDIHSRIVRTDQALSITRGEEGCFLWDDVAAAYLLYPERFKLVPEIDQDGNRLFNAVYVSEKLYFED